MVDCITIKFKKTKVNLDQFVRMKRGKYSGDIAQVIDINDVKN